MTKRSITCHCDRGKRKMITFVGLSFNIRLGYSFLLSFSPHIYKPEAKEIKSVYIYIIVRGIKKEKNAQNNLNTMTVTQFVISPQKLFTHANQAHQTHLHYRHNTCLIVRSSYTMHTHLLTTYTECILRMYRTDKIIKRHSHRLAPKQYYHCYNRIT